MADGRRIPFTREDEERIASAAYWGMLAAITSIASAVLSAMITLVRGLSAGTVFGQVVTLAISALLGVWLFQASAAFRKVAVTDVADERYLLEGFAKLRSYFMLTGILILLAISLGTLVLLGTAVCALGA